MAFQWTISRIPCVVPTRNEKNRLLRIKIGSAKKNLPEGTDNLQSKHHDFPLYYFGKLDSMTMLKIKQIRRKYPIAETDEQRLPTICCIGQID